MALSWREWARISKDVWVTDVIHNGYVIPFRDQPPTSKPKAFPSYSKGSVRYLALDGEVTKMLTKGAIEPVAHPDPDCRECSPKSPGISTGSRTKWVR